MTTMRLDDLKQYSDTLRTRSGEPLTVRFVEPRDSNELRNYFRSLSANSRYNRFFGPMRELHKLTHQPVNLSMRQGDEIVYIERAYSERSGMQVVRAIGTRAPLHLTSVGKLFLAADDPQRVRAYATRTGLAGHTKNSLTQLPALERELAKVRQYGNAHDNEELELGVRCMAAGIYDDQGRLVAGLSISAPADRLDDSWMSKLQATANEISLALGYRRAPGA